MLSFGVTIPATVPQRSEIPEGFMNYPVLGNMEIYCIFKMWCIIGFVYKKTHLFNNFVFLFCN